MRSLSLSRTGRLVAAGALAFIVPLSASAAIEIAVDAQEETAAGNGLTFDPPVTRAWGRAIAASGTASVQIEEGSAPPCPITCVPGPTLPGARAVARADATRMNVGVFARGFSTFTTLATAEVSVRDTLNIPAPGMLSFDIRLDFDIAASAAATAQYRFGIALGSGDDRFGVFNISAQEDDGVRTAQVLLDDAMTVLDLPEIPTTYERVVNIPVFPGPIAIEVFASAFIDAGNAEFALVDAYNSAWLGIGGSFTSANGYSYPGFAAAIPEPSQAALLLAGLTIVGLGCGRGRFGDRLHAIGRA